MKRPGKAIGIKNKSKAQAVVEFALVIPIVLIMVLGIIEGGWLITTYTLITSAGREAARYGSGIGNSSAGMPFYNDCSGIRDAAMRIGLFAGIKPSDIHIFHDTGPDTAKVEYCTPTTPAITFGRDDRIVVTVDILYRPISPLVVIPALPLRSQSSHTVLMGADVVAVSQVIPVTGQLCNVSNYTVLSESNPLGPTNLVKIKNTSGSATSIKSVLIVWDTTGGSVLQSITGIPGIPSPINSAGPSFSQAVDWPFPVGISEFTLKFSKVLKNDVIIRFTLAGEKQCAFGK